MYVVFFYFLCFAMSLSRPTSSVFSKQIIISPVICIASCVAEDNSPWQESYHTLTNNNKSFAKRFTWKVPVWWLFELMYWITWNRFKWSLVCVNSPVGWWQMIPLKSSVIGGMCVWCEPGLFTDLLSASGLSAGHYRGSKYTQEMLNMHEYPHLFPLQSICLAYRSTLHS